MDDPWGSPWADEVQLPQTIKPSETKDVGIRPTTPARAATLTLQEKTNSPWNDAADDSFGDWAALPTDNGRSLGLDGQADEWEHGDPVIKTKSDNNALSLEWDVSRVEDDLAVKLAPSPLLGAGESARLPSPDPWATSFTIDKQDVEVTQEHIEQHHAVLELEGIDGKLQKGVFADASLLAGTAPESGSSEVLPGEEATDSVLQDMDDNFTASGAEEAHSEASPVITEAATFADLPEGGPPSSRPSSSPSEHSQHDEMFQESPRTSLDEEPKRLLRLQRPRVVSSKVQGLVEHFDALGKQNVTDVAASSTSSGQDTIKGVDDENKEQGAEKNEGNEDDDDDDDDYGDFGDFEEGQSDGEQDQVRSEIVHPDAQTASTPSRGTIQSIVKKFEGPVDFDVDLSKVEEVFPGLEADAPVEKVFIMDTIPYDSFATEERKTWYRISRYGTMRKHNTGEDDYVRINWNHSQMRKETLKIVGRWMEEDRISGRVVLGGVSKGSSIFGWNDKKAASVPLADAFAAKAAGKRKVESGAENTSEIPREWPQDLARKTSGSKRSPSRSGRRSSTKATEPAPVAAPAAPPIASFGWNAVPPKPQSLDNPVLPVQKSTESIPKAVIDHSSLASILQQSSSGTPSFKSKPPSWAFPDDSRPIIPVVNESKPTLLSTQPLTKLAIPDTEDDEDDWGEMIASPVVKVEKSTLSDPRHLSSTPASQLMSTPPPMSGDSKLPSTHRKIPSLDEIFTPVSAGPSMDNFDGLVRSALPSAPVVLPMSSATSAADPWASADFSFFDAAPAPTPAAAPVPPPKPTCIRKPAPGASKSVSFSPSPLGPPRGNGRSKEEIEQDKIVQAVVKSLPDLSYMLRR